MKRSVYSHPLFQSGILWIILLVAVIFCRPLLNTIEVRLMTVAWEMHVRDQFLVPSLNFVPYTQKPPLLAWLINAGWMIFGAQRWVASVIIGAFSFGCVAWTWAIARLLWPHDKKLTDNSVWLCLGSAILLIFGTLIFYDMMLTFFALGCIYMLLQASSTNRKRYFLGLGIFLGLAGLTKGPVILVHILPLALLAPVWSSTKLSSWWNWYSKITASLLIGFAIGFGWAIPAALQGGHNYAHWILLEQTTHRVVKAFNHQQPWWYYLELGPVLLLPWLFMPSFWRQLPFLKQNKTNPALKFLLCWIISVFILFSAISGKQLHYLLPIWPAGILLLSYLYGKADRLRSLDYICVFAPLFVLGTGWLILNVMIHHSHVRLSPLIDNLMDHATIYPLFYIIGLGLCVVGIRHVKNDVIAPAVAMVMTIVFIHLAVGLSGFSRFTTQPVATALENILNTSPERPVATTTIRYQGDLNYPARLVKPLTILPPDNPTLIEAFFKQHPDGLIVMNVRDLRDTGNHHILAKQPYRSKRWYVLVER